MNNYNPIESKEFPTWYEIPGYSNYLANKEGQVLNKSTKELVYIKPHHQGYIRYNVRRGDEPHVRSVFAHRLIAFAFYGLPIGNKNTVNHIDGNKQNNHYTNLEWSSQLENNLHAIRNGLKDITKDVAVLNTIENNITIYRSMREVVHELKIDKYKLNRILHRRDNTIRFKHYLFRFLFELKRYPFPETFIKYNINRRLKNERTILVKRLSDNEVFEFNNPTEVTEKLGIHFPTLCSCLSLKKQYLRCGYLVKYKIDNEEWIDNTEIEKRNKFRQYIIKVTDEDKNIQYFNSIKECSMALKVSIITIRRNFKKKSQKGYIFEKIREG